MRQVKRFPMLLSMILCVGCILGAQARPVGLAESASTFQIHRESGRIRGISTIPSLIQNRDDLVAEAQPVRLQTASGSTILVGPRSTVTVTDENRFEVKRGEMAAAFSPLSPLEFAYQDLTFTPLTVQSAGELQPKLAIRAISENEVVVAGWNQPFMAVKADREPVQVAVVGHNDVIRFLRNDRGSWIPFKMQTPATGGSSAPPAPVDETKNEEVDEEIIETCPCESEFILIELEEDIAGAITVPGLGRCKKESTEEEEKAPEIEGFAIVVGNGEALCLQEMKVPITVYNAPPINSFKMTLLFEDRCLDYVSIDETEASKDWDFEVDDSEDNKLIITGNRGEEGLPVSGTAELVEITFRCAPPIILWWRKAVVTGLLGLGGGAVVAGGGYIIYEETQDDDDDRRAPSSPILPSNP